MKKEDRRKQRVKELIGQIVDSNDPAEEMLYLLEAIACLAHVAKFKTSKKAYILQALFESFNRFHTVEQNVRMLTGFVMETIGNANADKKPKVNERSSMMISVVGSIRASLDKADWDRILKDIELGITENETQH